VVVGWLRLEVLTVFSSSVGPTHHQPHHGAHHEWAEQKDESESYAKPTTTSWDQKDHRGERDEHEGDHMAAVFHGRISR
jgi:transcription elongation factor